MLERQKPARPPHSGLDLVEHEQRPVAAAQLLRARQVARRWDPHTFALHRLDDEGRHILALKLLLEAGEIPERNGIASRHQRSEAFPELRVAVNRQGSEG